LYRSRTSSPKLVIGSVTKLVSFHSQPSRQLDTCLSVYLLTYDSSHTELPPSRQSPLNVVSHFASFMQYSQPGIRHPNGQANGHHPHISLPLSRLSESENALARWCAWPPDSDYESALGRALDKSWMGRAIVDSETFTCRH
jgi:hypothetical protein